MNTASQTPGGDQLFPEDRARANVYALIGRLFYSAPDSDLFAQICAGSESGEGASDPSALEQAWRTLQNACRNAYPDVAKQEYDSLFVGVGKAPVTPYLFGYAEPAAPDRHLVRLRDQLTKWRFLRRNNVFEVEDHVSALSDVMRLLIEEGRPLEEQQRFFASFLYPGAMPFFAALHQAPAADFYKLVAAFANAFFEVEKEAFEMVDSV